MKNDNTPDSWLGWTLKKIELYESRRDSTSKATFKTINEALNIIISDNEGIFGTDFKILEIGSGAGFAIGLFSRYSADNYLTERWVQSEPNPDLASENERKYGKQVIVSSIRALPGILAGKTFPLVLAVNWLDTQIGSVKMNQLESTVNDLHRLISPEGSFIHFMDLNPSYDVVVPLCESYPLAYPFPFYNKDMQIGVQFISRKDIENLVTEKAGKPGVEQLKPYLENPLNRYLKLVSGNSLGFKQLANLIHHLVESYRIHVHKQVTFIQYFEDLVKLAFKPEDWLVSIKTVSGEILTDLEDRHKKIAGIVTPSGDKQEIVNNTIISAFGFAMGRKNDESVPHGKIREITHMHILTAQKHTRNDSD